MNNINFERHKIMLEYPESHTRPPNGNVACYKHVSSSQIHLKLWDDCDLSPREVLRKKTQTIIFKVICRCNE